MSQRVAIIIPCYKVKRHVLDVVKAVGPEVERIYVVDDGCPEETGQHVERACSDPRVRVLYHAHNRGVGGAMITGYRQALADGGAVMVKVDGDGQMDPALIPRFIQPLLEGKADYVKGNRFFHLEDLSRMPAFRLFGNAVLSLVNKVVSGYWDVMDPTNGYTAIHVDALRLLPLDKLDGRYFFESDMLFRLGTIRAVVRDVAMTARYAGEPSSLRIRRVLFEFPPKYLLRLLKRIFYTYFLRDFNAGTVELCVGLPLFGFGSMYGGYHWYQSVANSQPAASGVVMLAALPTILGSQFLLAALSFDTGNVPKKSLQELTR